MSENPSYTLSEQPPPTTSSQPGPFFSYDETLDVSASARVFCEIIKNASIEEIERLLSSCGIKPSFETVEEVLRLSYGSPMAAVKFFRWVESVRPIRSARVWDLMVDLLGSNGLFEQMWDGVRSMRDLGVLSLGTFVSVFRSYCGADRVEEAVKAFDVMEKYGIRHDVAGVNSLLREICRGKGRMEKALNFFEHVKGRVSPDVDTYAILMEGLEREKDVERAKTLFGEMVLKVGWCPGNVAVYDAFLITLCKGMLIDDAVSFLPLMKDKNCFPGMRFFTIALDILYEKNDLVHTTPLWDIMVNNGILPNVAMFNSIIGLFCKSNKIDHAICFLDEMVKYGAFPDSVTYNTIFKCLIKNKKVREAGRFFTEMTKNECPPTHLNCAAAIALFFDGDDPEMAVEIWHYMVINRVLPLEEGANMLLIGLCNLGRLTELKRFADKMLDRNVHISAATMAKIKQNCLKRGGNAVDTYDSLSRKWKSTQ